MLSPTKLASIGLRHNHKASTAYSITQLRDPVFTTSHGSTASNMAYGRFNYNDLLAFGFDISVVEFLASSLESSGIKEIIRAKLPSLEVQLNTVIEASTLPPVKRHYQALLRQVSSLKNL